MNSDKRIQTLVLIALFAALTFIGTMIKIPLPTGAFIHFGNAVVLLAVLLISYWQGSLAGGIVFFIFDILNGFASEAPYFLLESFVVGAAAYAAFSIFKQKPQRVYQIVIIGIFAGITKFIMSVIKVTVMGMIAGAQLKPAFLAALATMPATVINLFSTILIVSLVFFPLRRAMQQIFHNQPI
ncbi:ECF transporter S component [Enterococcus dongliensis]|uniref:ECF transporter S component n=1 Tax=Enterococcus dongliensis TaxID=2559925 RepID=A0AAW8TPW1_9ENTE|nr:ECF transporter S component [Enterococcus dongliensis]MDT2634719.1 ECF transporter S component [Enterococcus dongliensis]MDT2637771.1 ECF transporter S component [Enterococcus dongliensis]MDT2642789.1 ECF transporter S component [Enterococcus dongliensis]